MVTGNAKSFSKLSRKLITGKFPTRDQIRYDTFQVLFELSAPKGFLSSFSANVKVKTLGRQKRWTGEMAANILRNVSRGEDKTQ